MTKHLVVICYSSCVEVNALIYQSDDVVKYCSTRLWTCVYIKSRLSYGPPVIVGTCGVDL